MDWMTVVGVVVLVAFVAWLIMRGRKKDAEVGASSSSPVKPVSGGGGKDVSDNQI